MGEKRRLCGIWRRREGGRREQRIRGIDGSNSGLNELTDRTTAPGNGRIWNGAGHGECAPRGRVLGWSLAPLTELLYDKGGLVSNKHDAPYPVSSRIRRGRRHGRSRAGLAAAPDNGARGCGRN